MSEVVIELGMLCESVVSGISEFLLRLAVDFTLVRVVSWLSVLCVM